MDTQLLNAFVAVACEESFSAAAEQLGLTQSAMSKRIALLETQVNQPLFDRLGRNIVLTEAGSALLPRAKRIVQDINDAQQFMHDLKGHVSGVLRIGTSHHIGLHRLPPVLKVFTQQYPEVHLQLHFIDSERAIEAILQGVFDLVFVTLPKIILEDKIDNIQYCTLWHDPMCFVANHEHPLNRCHQRQTIELADLARLPAILPDTNTYTTQLIQALFDREQCNLHISMTTNHLDAIKMMVTVGLGWSVLPTTLITKELSPLSVSHTQPVSHAQLNRQLGLIYHRERTLSNASRAMIKLASQKQFHCR